MEGNLAPPRTNILINLSSRLLSEALQGLLERNATACLPVTAHDLDRADGFIPDKVLVDAATLQNPLPAPWGGAKVILIDTGLAEEEIIRLLIAHRLDGVISTGTDTGLFRKALQTIREGQVWIDNGKIKALLQNPAPAPAPPGAGSFSKKEQEIIHLVTEGYKNREIAVQLNMSEQTVKTHLSHIFKKAKVRSRAQLAPLALKFRP